MAKTYHVFISGYKPQQINAGSPRIAVNETLKAIVIQRATRGIAGQYRYPVDKQVKVGDEIRISVRRVS